MKFTIEVKREAYAELADIFSFYNNISQSLGDKFLTAWDRTIKEIVRNPLGYEVKHIYFRQAMIRKFPHMVIFECFKQTVIIYAVLHAKKHPSKRYRRK